MFGFGDGSGQENKRGDSLAAAGKKTARMRFPVPKKQRKVGDYSVCGIANS